MNRNTNAHFAELPKVDISRSVMDRSWSHKTAGNVGQLIPIYVDPDILPGDTVTMDTSKVIRFETMLSPMMDNIQCDIYWFFVPHRLVWDHWINFMGENTSSAWIPQVEYSVPKLVVPDADGSGAPDLTCSVLDYMGFPVGMNTSGDVEVNALPVRAYSKVVQDWFVSENLTDPLVLYTGDSDVNVTVSGDYKYDVPCGSRCFTALKYADYFTSCLPSPQKGNPVTLPIKVGGSDTPVFTSLQDNSDLSDIPIQFKYYASDGYESGFRTLGASLGNPNNVILGSAHTPITENPAVGNLKVSNLVANIPIMETYFSVNDLRYAFQLQKLLERDARSGSRYIEVIRSHFGVQSSDARLQRSEYLGGNRFGIVVDQVCNTAQAETEFLGDLGAFSVTSDVHSDFTWSAQEHGTLLGLMVLRYDHTYSQGLQKFWSRDSRFDYYWPVFANIGEQPVLKKELYLTGNSTTDDAVFGYNEAWADWRFMPNRVSSYMRPYLNTGLKSWSLADNYNQTPSLSDAWMREEPSNVDRVLAVTSASSGFQFWADIYFSTKYTRCMPVYSIPGLIDHN